MKRFILILTVVFGFTVALNAQNYVNTLDDYYAVYTIPGVFTNNGHSNVLYATDDGDYCVYDNDFSTVLFTSSSFLSPSLQEGVLYCYYIDVSAGESFNNSSFSDKNRIYFTQNLFNSDDNYEYLAYDENWNLCVKSTNGSVIQIINPEEGYVWDSRRPFLFNLDNNIFLVLNEEINGQRKYVVYRIDQATGLTKVDVELPISAFPTVADRSQQITVELGEGTNAKEITVVNSLGQVVKRVPLEEGQRVITIPASALGSGLNVVNTRTEQGQGSCKIIVR